VYSIQYVDAVVRGKRVMVGTICETGAFLDGIDGLTDEQTGEARERTT